MTRKRAEAVVAGDEIRLWGSTGPYRTVLGLSHEAGRVLIWQEDPDHKGEPIGAPISVTRGGDVDAQPAGTNAQVAT